MYSLMPQAGKSNRKKHES